GENANNVVVKPYGYAAFLVGLTERALDSPDVKNSGRFLISESSLKQATERVLASWKKAETRKALHVEYLGVYRVSEAGGSLCYKLHRHKYDRPDEDGVNDLVLYIDTKTWLQVGSILHGEGGRLLGEYYFRDIQLNPEFSRDQFTKDMLKR